MTELTGIQIGLDVLISIIFGAVGAIVVDEITKTVIDYTALPAADQAKLDAFNQLLIDNCW
jgi:hypothetical protein